MSTDSVPDVSHPSISEKVWYKCNKMIEHAEHNSPRVQGLLRKLRKSGCDIDELPIVCEDSFYDENGPAAVGGAYSFDRRQVVINPNVPASHFNQGEITRAITHELVHAYDFCRAKLEPSNCDHIACTEIRASNLSGDCDFGPELQRVSKQIMIDGVASHQKQCVRRRATLSVSMHEQCAESATRSVNKVWEYCYNDNAPFYSN